MPARVEGEIVIRRPAEAVFDFVADERNEPRYNPRMVRAEKLTAGPIGVGTRWSAAMAGRRRPVEMTIEVTQFDRPVRLASRTRMAAMTIEGALTFEPLDGATLMRWSWDLRPRGALRLLGPLVRLLGVRRERAIWTGLKRRLESPEP